VPYNDENRESFLPCKDNMQGDCFVPRNDGKSPTVTHLSNEGKSVDSSLRENLWNKKLIILQEVERGFRGNLLKRITADCFLLPMTLNKEFTSCLTMTKTESHSCLAKTTYKEIASFLAMTAKARRYLIPPLKERVLIRHCEKTFGTRTLLFCKKLKGVFVAIF